VSERASGRAHGTQRRTRWRHNLADVGAKWTWATTTTRKVWASGPADADAGGRYQKGVAGAGDHRTYARSVVLASAQDLDSVF